MTEEFDELDDATFDKLIEMCRKKYENGMEVEGILQFLRNERCNFHDSMTVIDESTDLSANDVKRAVYLSETWADFRG